MRLPPAHPTTTTIATHAAPNYGPQPGGRRPGLPEGGCYQPRALTISAVENPPGSGSFLGEVRDNARPGWVWRAPHAMPSHTAALALAQAHAAALREGLQHGGLTLEDLPALEATPTDTSETA